MSETLETPGTPETQTPKKRALLSVSDRTGLVELGTALVGLGYELLSTGGTAHVLSDAGLPVNLISEITGFPEVFDGRVKTLHPKIFGGILYDRSVETHRKEADANAITPVDLVAVNLYPFKESLETGTASFEDLIEKIDVGGPSMLRAAAKNHAHVTVLCDPADYAGVVAELAGGGVSAATRRRLAAKVFRRTAAYDAVIASYLTSQAGEREPERLTLTFLRDRTLRYGENPHQQGAFYVDPLAPQGSLARFTSHQGKELSFNNLLDADAAVFSSRSIGPNGLTIVKHRIASGIATGATFAEALEKAWASDPVAAFGGVIAYLGTLDAEGAAALGTRFVEVLVVSHILEEALPLLAKKPNLRVLSLGDLIEDGSAVELRGIEGGLLVEDRDRVPLDESAWKVVTGRAPSDAEMNALRFAFRAVRGVVSNGIVVTGADATYGIGGGRTSRVDACRDAIAKAGSRARGAVAASDAFFPFPDGLEVLLDAGVTAVVQPGGSVKDAEVIATADARDIAMVTTGRRHFRH